MRRPLTAEALAVMQAAVMSLPITTAAPGNGAYNPRLELAPLHTTRRERRRAAAEARRTARRLARSV